MSRNLDTAEGFRATTSDLDLRTRNIELWWRARVMDGELLDTDEVVSWGDTRRDRDTVALRHVPGAAGEFWSDFLDLEAVSREGVGVMGFGCTLNQSELPSAWLASATLLM